MDLKNLSKYSQSGVFCLVDSVNKCFYTNYTINFKYFIAEVYEILRLGEVGAETTELLEFSSTTDIETLKIHVEIARDELLGKGYTEIRPRSRSSIKYHVRSLVSVDFRHYDVQLVSKRGTKVVTVGRFKTKKEADMFIYDYYSEEVNPYLLPVVSINSLTKELNRQTEELGLHI